MNIDVQALADRVQTNCHIADAEHAGDYTLCVYLLKMREYFRWEKNYPFGARLPNDEVGNWLTAREALWDRLRDQSYAPLVIGAREYDPLETDAINTALREHDLVYSGGLGGGCRPHFFLGHLQRSQRHEDYSVLVAGDELARDLAAPPAMALGRTIFIRRESLRRMIWEKVEEWSWHKKDSPMGRAITRYGFDRDMQAALESMTDAELEPAILHEVGELRAGQILGTDWEEMLAVLPRSQAELMARAVRDHLADCLSTLPALIDAPDPASLHFYFGNLHAMRRQLFPALRRAYEHWMERDDPADLHETVRRGAHHWRDVAARMLELYREHGEQCPSRIANLAEDARL